MSQHCSIADDIVDLYRGLEQELAALIGPIRFSSEINMRLERITELLVRLDNPQKSFPSIHVGGTSGKGSTATMIAAILKEAGYKTGLHVSPHLQILNERHQIDGQVTPTSRLVELFREMKPVIAKMAVEHPFGAPSYFEAQVALALYLFQQEQVDIAVVEVGLGGTLDATNVLDAKVAVLTNVGLDHTAILGDTIEAIAADKAGIIKPGQIVVSGVQQQAARDILTERCQARGAELWQLGQAFKAEIQERPFLSVSTPARTYVKLDLGMRGDFQNENAACAVAAVSALPDFTIPEEAVRKGLLQAQLPGRMEIVQHRPLVILDGAHNPEKMGALSRAINDSYSNRRRLVILSLKSDKAAGDVLPHILPGADRLVITKFRLKGLWEAMEPDILAEMSMAIAPDLAVTIESDPIVALKQCLAAANAEDLILVTGSLYLVGNIREYWYPSSDLIVQAEKGLAGALIP